MRSTPVGLVVITLLMPLAWAGLPADPLVMPVTRAVWHSELLDDGPVSLTRTGLAVDSHGVPSVVYHSDETWLRIRYAVRKSDGSWSLTLLPGKGALPDVALDAQNRPHVSSWTLDRENPEHHLHLNHTWWDGTGWKTETVDDGKDVGRESRIEVDAQGRVHISYYDLPNGRLKYALKDSARWVVETIDDDFVGWNDLALDSEGRAHIAYATSNGKPWGGLGYATRTSQGWQIQVLDDNGGGNQVSLQLDSQDRPHIAYMGANEVLKYTRWTGQQWKTDVVDESAPTGRHSSLQLDSQDQPHIAYYQVVNRAWFNDPTRGHVMYAVKDVTGEWHQRVVGWGITSYPNLLLDEDDAAHITYMHREDQVVPPTGLDTALMYARPLVEAVVDT